MGQYGAVGFVRHGGTLVREHHSRLCKINTQDQESAKQTVQDNSETASEKCSLNNGAESSDGEENPDSEQENISDVLPWLWTPVTSDPPS